VRAAWRAGRTFHEKGVGSRAIVVAAGPIANFVLAMVLFAGLFAAMGRPIVLPVVGEAVAGGAAASAGLVANDRIVAIDGAPTASFEDIQRIVGANPGRTVTMRVLRDGTERSLPVTLGSRTTADGGTVGVLGVRGGVTEYVRVGPLEAVRAGVRQTWDVTVLTLSGVWQLLSGAKGADELSGPLGIARMSGQVAQLGIAPMISFIAVLSINLGLINLFPIPVLDGGHLLFYLAEAVRGRALPQRVLEYGFRAGLAVLAFLFVFATWNDLRTTLLFRWVSALIG
jgi:regulator of sigma E protease